MVQQHVNHHKLKKLNETQQSITLIYTNVPFPTHISENIFSENIDATGHVQELTLPSVCGAPAYAADPQLR